MIEIPSNNVITWPDFNLSVSSKAPKKPFKASMSCEIPMTQDMRKQLREMNRTQPNLKHPRRKRPWRLVRKWFNRYQKPKMLGMFVMVEPASGPTTPMQIIDVKIRKGYPGVMYDYSCKSIL